MRQVHDKSESGLINLGLNIYNGTALGDKILDGNTVICDGQPKGNIIRYPLESPKLIKNPDTTLG